MSINGILGELNFKKTKISHVFINIITMLIIFLLIINSVRLVIVESGKYRNY